MCEISIGSSTHTRQRADHGSMGV